MRKTCTRLALCILAFGTSGVGAGAEPRVAGCPAPLGSTLAEFEACAPAAVRLRFPAPVVARVETAAPVAILAPVVAKAPVQIAAPVRVATVQRAARKTKRLTMVPWLVGAFQ